MGIRLALVPPRYRLGTNGEDIRDVNELHRRLFRDCPQSLSNCVTHCVFLLVRRLAACASGATPHPSRAVSDLHQSMMSHTKEIARARVRGRSLAGRDSWLSDISLM